MEPGEEITAGIERGKTLVIRYLALGDADVHGERTVFFELNGHPRTIKVTDHIATITRPAHAKADPGNPAHVGAPMPGVVIAVAVETGQRIERGDPLLTLEAMKMETVLRAEQDGTIAEILLPVGESVATDDLLIVLQGSSSILLA